MLLYDLLLCSCCADVCFMYLCVVLVIHCEILYELMCLCVLFVNNCVVLSGLLFVLFWCLCMRVYCVCVVCDLFV